MGAMRRNRVFGQLRSGAAVRTVLAGALAAGALAAVAGATASASSPASPATIATGNGGTHQVRDVSANLWEWNWPSVAREC